MTTFPARQPIGVLEVLQTARQLIADEQHWCQQSYALNAEQICEAPMSPEATQWCALGALYAATADTDTNIDAAVEALLESDIDENWMDGDIEALIEYNDTHAHCDVIDRFDEAIEYAQQRMVAT